MGWRADLPVPDRDPEEVRRALDDILSGTEFRRPAPTLVERIQEFLGDLIGGFLERLAGSGSGTVLAWIVLVAAIAATVWLLVRFGRTVTTDRAVERSEVMVELTRTPAEWRAEAQRLEAEGRWAEGIRARYRALVAELVASAVLHDAPGRTSGEYRREVAAARPDLDAAFSEATALFESAWYGDAPVGAADRDRFEQAAASLSGVRA